MRSGPDYIQYYPTLRCNKACDFCFNRGISAMHDMPLDAFRTMLAVLANIGIRTLDIIGGEPTLHPSIAAIVGETGRQGISVNLSSNGSNLPLLAELMHTGIHVNVGISINDPSSFDHARDFIFANRPVVKSIFQNRDDVGLVKNILSLSPARFYYIYRDALDHQELAETVPFHQFHRAMKNRFDPKEVYTVSCSGFLPDTDQYPELSNVRCPAGTTKLGVMPDGSVYPCNLFFGNKEFRLGNILEDPFPAIWNHTALAFFRTAGKNRCPENACGLHDCCHGGCPAHSYVHSGRLDAPDPRCCQREQAASA